VRGRLFIKIFLGFWLVTVAIIASWNIVIGYIDTQPQLGPPHSSAPPHRFMLRLMYSMQNASDQELQQLIKTVKTRDNIDIFLLDRKGKELFDRTVQPSVIAAAKAMNSHRRRFRSDGPEGLIAGHIIYRENHGPLRAVVVVPHHRQRVLGALQRNLWLRTIIAVLVSGLICYWLSRIFTRRLKRLQQASRKIAGGDLDTRIEVRRTGGDETDELARDFNTMAKQLAENIQSYKRLLHDVSHELRSPLTRLRLALALAEKDTDNQQQHLQRIEAEAERLDDLIGQLLDVPESQLNLDEHLDLKPLLEQLCAEASFEGKASGKSVGLHSDIGSAVVATKGDLLLKAFGNILRNGVKYTAENTVVSCRLVQVDQAYVIRVQDQGPGVPEEELGSLFDEFYRVDSARTRETGGYGLGLAIARRAIVQHAGTIQASNTADGLMIEVQLPMSDEHGD